MSAAEYDLYIQKGETFRRVITLTYPDVDPVTNLPIQVPVDLTGCSAVAFIKPFADDKAIPLAEIDCTIDDDPTTGVITISLPLETTETIPTTGKNYRQISKYVWDMLLIDSLGEAIRLFNGFVDVSPRASRVTQYA